MSEGYPANARKRNYAGYRLRYKREHASRPRMEEQRIVAVDQELIEGKASRCCLGYAG